MATLQITNTDLTPTIKRLYSGVITVSGQKNVSASPNANGNSKVEVQTQSYDNPVYTIQGINIDYASDGLQWTDVTTLYKQKYNGTNSTKLIIKYGSTDKVIPDLDGVTSGIPVVLTSFNGSISVKDTKDAYLPQMTLTFQETD